MVCVTRQKTCERLIKIGQRLVNGEGKLMVVRGEDGRQCTGILTKERRWITFSRFQSRRELI